VKQYKVDSSPGSYRGIQVAEDKGSAPASWSVPMSNADPHPLALMVRKLELWNR
jgi:hypothetical protein